MSEFESRGRALNQASASAEDIVTATYDSSRFVSFDRVLSILEIPLGAQAVFAGLGRRLEGDALISLVPSDVLPRVALSLQTHSWSLQVRLF